MLLYYGDNLRRTSERVAPKPEEEYFCRIDFYSEWSPLTKYIECPGLSLSTLIHCLIKSGIPSENCVKSPTQNTKHFVWQCIVDKKGSLPATSARRCQAGPLVVTVWRLAGTSPRMSPAPTIAMFEVEGYATFESLFLQITAVAVNSVYRVALSLRRITNRSLLKIQTRTKVRLEEG